jgi:dynein heavy chain
LYRVDACGQVQNFINFSFENILSTEQALALLNKFESILVRDSLKADLDSKYTVIFQNYGLDVETVQRLYEKHKADPPMVPVFVCVCVCVCV